MYALFVYRDASAPAIPKLSDTKHPAVFVICSGDSLILQIEALRNVPKIAKPIVCPRAVDMVDVVNWPSLICIKPSKPMSKVLRAVNANLYVPPAVDRASGVPLLRSTANGVSPMKHPGAGVVIQQFAQTRSGKMSRSHEALQLLIGQRPLGVDASQRPRHFRRKAG